VIGKTARVVEEVVVQKKVDERAETVRDTVRKEEVEITGPHGAADRVA
jgi:stress response protein YsnF